MKQFDIPIALIFFNRPEFLKKQLQILKKIAPEKLYLISDGPRNDRPHEKEQVEKCRTLAEKEITWNCKIIKNYALENMGCFDRIANGASWVFEQEEMCIFLEDDSIPELTFFQYCKDLLLYYKNDSKIFWICGNNYLIDYKNQDS